MKNNSDISLKKYFDILEKKIENYIQKNELDVAYEMTSMEIDNPFLDLESSSRFQKILQRIENLKEKQNEKLNEDKNKTKKDYYNLIYDEKTHRISEYYLEEFLIKYINQLTNTDFLFLNLIFEDKILNPKDKLNAFYILVKNNISTNINYYNKMLDETILINPISYITTNSGFDAKLFDDKIVKVDELLQKKYFKDPSLYKFSYDYLITYALYFFPYKTKDEPYKLADVISKFTEISLNQIPNQKVSHNFLEDEVDIVSKILETTKEIDENN